MFGFTYMVSMSLMRDNPKVGGGCSRIVSSTLATAPTPSPRVESRSPSKVQEIPAKEATRRPSEEARGAPEVPSKRRAGDSAGQRKKSKDFGRHKLPHEANRSTSRAAKGKGPTGPAKETPTPRLKLRSVRELCNACPGVDDRVYHAIHMCNLPERAPDAPLEIDLAPLTYGDEIWLDGEASEGGDLNAVAVDEARASEAQSLADNLQTELDEVNRHRESVEKELSEARGLLADLRRQLADS
ncbi:hypothetical protein GW17_00029329 [Ensete ventricosum]|nr:hypothetical protein GW17_00029329 [Ensete ventricosum]